MFPNSWHTLYMYIFANLLQLTLLLRPHSPTLFIQTVFFFEVSSGRCLVYVSSPSMLWPPLFLLLAVVHCNIFLGHSRSFSLLVWPNHISYILCLLSIISSHTFYVSYYCVHDSILSCFSTDVILCTHIPCFRSVYCDVWNINLYFCLDWILDISAPQQWLKCPSNGSSLVVSDDYFCLIITLLGKSYSQVFNLIYTLIILYSGCKSSIQNSWAFCNFRVIYLRSFMSSSNTTWSSSKHKQYSMISPTFTPLLETFSLASL